MPFALSSARIDLNKQIKSIKNFQDRIQLKNRSFETRLFSDPLFAEAATKTVFSDDEQNPDWWKILYMSQEVKDNLKQSADYIKYISDTVSALTTGINFVDPMLKLMGIIPSQNDQFQALFDKIKVEIHKVHSDVVQASMLDTMKSIDNSVAKAKSAAQAVTAWVQQGKPTGDGVLYDSAKAAELSSREAVNELRSKSNWLRLYDVDVYAKANAQIKTSAGPWSAYTAVHPLNWKNFLGGSNIERMSTLVPREEGSFVWDYQIALPAYLFAICARLTVLQGHYPDFKTINQIYLDEIKDMYSKLDEVWTKFQNGLWAMPADQWLAFAGFGPYCSHYCTNIYTGEFVGGDKMKDTAVVQDNTKNGKLILSRYLALLTPVSESILSAMADLSQIINLPNAPKPPVPSWHDWENLGGKIIGDIGALAVPGKNAIDLYVRDEDSNLSQKFYDQGKWSNWFKVDETSKIFSSPVVVSGNASQREIYATGAKGNVLRKFWDGQWHGWEDLGGPIKGDVAAVKPEPAVTDLYARGTDDALYQKYFANGKWTDWFLLDNKLKLASSPVAVSGSVSHRAIYVRDADGNVFHKYFGNGQWHPWENLGQPPQKGKSIIQMADVGALALPNGVTDLYMRGGDLKLWQKYYSGNWVDWFLIDTGNFQFLSAPSVIAANLNRRDIFARGGDSQVYHKFWG